MTDSALRLLIEREVEEAISLLGEGIVHLDKLKWHDMLDFLKAWNLDKAKFHVTEKMDGVAMILGVENGKFYMRSKNMVFHSLEDISDASFLSDFKSYFDKLQSVPWDSIVTKLAAKHGFEYDGNLEIEGEAIPSWDHNIVMYDEAKIGDGIFVIFNTKTGLGKKDKTGRLTLPEMWKDLAEEANKYSTIKFFQVPEMDISGLEFDNDIVVSLEDLVEKHGNFLRKPARTPAAKELKAKLLQRVKEIGLQAKNQALGHDVSGKFGKDVEGVVISGPDGKLIKIVDTEKFTEVGQRNWHYLGRIFDSENRFRKALKADPDSWDVGLEQHQDEVDEVEREFEENGHEMVTIKRKQRETRERIDYQKALIAKLRRLAEEMPLDEVIELFVDKKIVPEGVVRKDLRAALNESAIQEGGNVFDGMNSVVPKPLLEPSISNALSLAGFDGLEYEIVGNKSKKFFNDIDIAVSLDKLADYLGMSELTDIHEFWSVLDGHLANSTVESFSIIKGLKQFHLLAPLVDSSGEQMNAFTAEGDRTDEPGMIQIDVFVGNLNWMKDINSGAPESSKKKAVWRNLLYYAIATVVRWKEPGDPDDVWNRYIMDFRSGLKKRKFQIIPPSGRRKKDKKVTLEDEIVTTSPDGLVQEFFGPGITWSDVNSYEALIKMINSSRFRFKEDRPEILAAFKKKMNND